VNNAAPAQQLLPTSQAQLDELFTNGTAGEILDGKEHRARRAARIHSGDRPVHQPVRRQGKIVDT
jgi:hypothetical protein